MTSVFAQWREHVVHMPEHEAHARELVHVFAKENDAFFALCTTPQSGPYHTEGPAVRDHIIRALSGLFALAAGDVQLLDVEEWRAGKEYEGFFLRLNETLTREKVFLAAYILAHDIGKKDVAQEDALGWHYHGHAAKGAEVGYAPFREACLRVCAGKSSEAKMLRELVRLHMDMIYVMQAEKEQALLLFAKSLAKKQGINAERFMALLPATYCIDALLGSLSVHEASFQTAGHLIFFAREEYRVFPELREHDARVKARNEKRNRLARYRAAGLDYDEWFVILHTPHGKERGEVAAILDRFIRGVEEPNDVRYVGSAHAQELRRRSAKLRNTHALF